MTTLTFLFTDIQGSTRLWENQPEAMRLAMDRHDAILRAAIENNSGRVFRTVGDAFCAVFPSAPNALAAAVEAQNLLYAEPWDLGTPLRVRIVLHTCDANPKDGDYVGAGLNRLGRLISACHGGQTLLSLATGELVRDPLPPQVSLQDLGLHRFRDLERPERIFQVNLTGLPASFLPLPTLDAIPNNLPVQLTSFIGRQRELVEVSRLLNTSHLLTLTGPGGTGKTRLALQAAAEGLDSFQDGAWLVELAPLSDATLILHSIAAVFNLQELPGHSLQMVITDFLSDRHLLLILDNCEHLIEACARLAGGLLETCPGLKIIASSREPLGIGGEAIYRVPSLSLPDQNAIPSPLALAESEAVQLLAERAKAVQPSFTLTLRNSNAVVQICRRLDGIPLALELAAARVNLFSMDQIAARLDNRFRLLTGGSRTALPRQQTLEALIDWSYELLSAEEKTFFCRLSVFAGGFTFEAAEAVCGEALDMMDGLVNKSMVLADEIADERRCRLLETMRQYARDKLLESGESKTIRERHLSFYHRFAVQAGQAVSGSDPQPWISRLDRELDNIWAALDWAIEHDPQAVVHICGEMAVLWSRQSFGSEGRRWIQEGIDRMGKLPSVSGEAWRTRQAILGKGYLGYGHLAITQGDNHAGLSAFQESARLFREIGDQPDLVFSLGMAGLSALFLGKVDLSRELAEEAIVLGQQINDHLGLGLALSVLGQIAGRVESDFATAQIRQEESIRMLRSSGDQWFLSIGLMALGLMALGMGDIDIAERRFKDSLGTFQKLSDRRFINVIHSGLADVARLRGEYEQAAHMYAEVITEWRILGNRGAIARCLECLAFMDIAQAKAGSGSEREAHLRRAASLLGAAEGIRKDSGSPMTPDEQTDYEAQVTELRALIEEKSFQLEWELGATTALDELLNGIAVA